MKTALVTDSRASFYGMRLAGADAYRVSAREPFENIVKRLVSGGDVGIIFVNASLFSHNAAFIEECREKTSLPLFCEIPDEDSFDMGEGGL